MKELIIVLIFFILGAYFAKIAQPDQSEYLEKDFIVDSTDYHSLQQDNIAQVNPYTRVHLKVTDKWLLIDGFVPEGKSVQVLILKK